MAGPSRRAGGGWPRSWRSSPWRAGGGSRAHRAAVLLVFTNEIGDLDFPPKIPTADPLITADFNGGPGWKFVHGLFLNITDIPGMRKASTGALAGLFNTHFFIDRTTGVCASIYTNSLPFVTEGPWTTYQNFERALYASL